VSRSRRAWTESCGLVSTATRRLARTVSSLTHLSWVATAVMFVLAINSAAAPGQVGRPHSGASVAPAAAGASQSHATTTPAPPNADPQHPRSTSVDGRNADQEVLALGSGYSDINGSSAVKTLQRRLIDLGYSPGPVDGRYGPATEGAVIDFQAVHGLHVDGITGPRTLATLASARPVLYPGDGYARGGSPVVLTVQRELAAAGFAPGPIDGRYGPLTEHAVMRFQAARRLPVDGIAGPQTLGRLETTVGPGVQSPKNRVSVRPGTVHRRPIPAAPRSAGAPGRTTATRPTFHRPTRSAGALPTGWIAILACLLAALFVAAVWRLRRGRGRHVRPSEAPAIARPESTAARTALEPREELPALTLADPQLRGRAAELLTDDAESHSANQHVGDSAYRLALLLERDGDLAAAEDVFRRADEAGHPAAAFELGVLRRRNGDRTGAKDALRGADKRGYPRAACDLGALLLQAGNQAEAEEWFRWADDRGDARAASILGMLLEQRGDPARAKDAYRRADERGHGVGACNLGAILEQEGDLAGAAAAYRRADKRGDSDGAYSLGLLLEREGDRAGARDAFCRADQRGHGNAAFYLGTLLLQDGDEAGAEEWFRRADERGDAAAASNLGVLLEQRGERAGAKDAYRRADERGHAVGACNLGLMLEQERDLVGAKGAYRRADERGDSVGAYMLGVLLEREGDRAGAKEAFRRADQRGHPAAACNLGLLLKREGDHVGARQALGRANRQGSEEIAAVAHAALLELGGDEESDR
jgi:peptidoglycan hydrolase-like protein with peptidoglycan-binding domain/TPR repeat protein